MSSYWPRFSREGLTNSVPPIDYLEWYIPRLQETRTHNLSFSGMQYDWRLDKLLGDSITELGKPHINDIIDPRAIIAERENVSVDNVLITLMAQPKESILPCLLLSPKSEIQLTVK